MLSICKMLTKFAFVKISTNTICSPLVTNPYMNDTRLEDIQYNLGTIKDNVKDIGDQIMIMNTTIMQKKNKAVDTYNEMETILRQLERGYEEQQNQI